nr:MAG TPA: hypothetical protein [Caudoviricetes sp.]
MNCFHKTFKPTFLGRLIFFAFFPVKLLTIHNERDIL